MNRRELLKGLMAGGMIVAGELWVPGQKLISIPSDKVFYGPSVFEMLGKDIRYTGPVHETATINEFHNWLRERLPNILGQGEATPWLVKEDGKSNEHRVSLRAGYRITNPEHLVKGILEQDRLTTSKTHGDREYWSTPNSLSDDELITDKVYRPDYYSTDPRERIREDENGLKGWR